MVAQREARQTVNKFQLHAVSGAVAYYSARNATAGSTRIARRAGT
jgi:hypothetical protein